MNEDLRNLIYAMIIVILVGILFLIGIGLGRKIERRSTENNTKTYAYCLEEEDAGSRN